LKGAESLPLITVERDDCKAAAANIHKFQKTKEVFYFFPLFVTVDGSELPLL